MSSPSINTILECAECGLLAVYFCEMTKDAYCTQHKRHCCKLMKFPQPKPVYTNLRFRN